MWWTLSKLDYYRLSVPQQDPEDKELDMIGPPPSKLHSGESYYRALIPNTMTLSFDDTLVLNLNN